MDWKIVWKMVLSSLFVMLMLAREGQSIDMSNISSRGTKKTVKGRRRMDLKFDEFNEERKNKQKALTSGYFFLSNAILIFYSLETPFVGSPRGMSETDASDSESEDIVPDDIGISESSKAPLPPPPTSRRDSLSIPQTTTAITKRTTLINPGREKATTESTSTTNTSSPPAPPNPRKRRRSELFTSTGKENISVLPPGSDLFSPPPQRTNEKAQRGVLLESSPPRPSLLIPAGLTRLESPNKPMNNTQMPIVVSKEAFEFLNDLEEGAGGRRVSRARKQVNYALPNLRDKMRREDKPDEKRRSISVDRSVTPDQGTVWIPV
jgi:hypothetical protein